MKRIIWIFLIVLLAVSCSGKNETASGGGSSATVKEGTPAPASDFDARLTQSGDGVEITYYSGNAKNLTIPTTIEDLPVVTVNLSSRNSFVEQVFIPEGVKQVGFGDNLPSLQAVSLPSTLERINGRAFDGCINLKAVSIPSNVTYIGDNAFRGSGIQSIIVPASVKNMGGAFRDCKSLTSVEIAGNDLRIEQFFTGCDSLKNVIINEGVTSIGEGAFRGLKSLETVKFPDSLQFIYGNAFYGCSSLGAIVIPKGVERIRENAFAFSGLTEVTITKTKEPLIIMGGAFRGCENLVTVNFEEGASIVFEQIDQFSDCPKLSLKSQTAIREASIRIN